MKYGLYTLLHQNAYARLLFSNNFSRLNPGLFCLNYFNHCQVKLYEWSKCGFDRAVTSKEGNACKLCLLARRIYCLKQAHFVIEIFWYQEIFCSEFLLFYLFSAHLGPFHMNLPAFSEFFSTFQDFSVAPIGICRMHNICTTLVYIISICFSLHLNVYVAFLMFTISSILCISHGAVTGTFCGNNNINVILLNETRFYSLSVARIQTKLRNIMFKISEKS